ncbi:MAG: response regulator [Chroococcidiopsidaceae cyanobacterium CP_BM_ER_R8_30]|nr:response regulator [Chroococcidiopsidaceae cyanobacterium CP_BM_ER_R8_30]
MSFGWIEGAVERIHTLDRLPQASANSHTFFRSPRVGLATAQGIVKSHGGFIDVKSVVGKGTQFKVYLPATEETKLEEAEDPNVPTGQGDLILVIDDETAMLEVTQAALETHNYRVITTNNGNSALALYDEYQSQVSVVVVDMMMPSMDGSTVIRRLQAKNPQLKIIAVSGLMSNTQVAETAGTSVKKFLPKPYTVEELLKSISLVLAC